MRMMTSAGMATEAEYGGPSSLTGRVSAKPRFNEKKSTQAAGRFLVLAGGEMNYMLLIKLLYLLDREMLRRRGRTVTGDEYYSMKLGPVLSEVHDLITEQQPPDQKSFWAIHISEPRSFKVRLLCDPGNGKLSEAEEEMIGEIFGHYGHYDPFKLVDHLHETLPEWTPVTHGREFLPRTKILSALGKTEEEIHEIQSEIDNLAVIDSLFPGDDSPFC